jgi:hypothetical protein
MTMLDKWCCRQELTIHRIERCLGGDQLTDSWTTLGLIERSLGHATQQVDMYNTAATVAYFNGNEPFWDQMDFNAAGYYVEYVLPNAKSEFYRILNFIEGYDFDCCEIDHYEAELERVKRPEQCQ